jgi:hypothetical protein
MQYDRLTILLDQLAKELKEFGFFCAEVDKMRVVEKRSTQKGVIRTNCMDCLDRTGVVQSVIGRRVLLRILAEAGIMAKSAAEGAAFEKLGFGLEETFRNVWTNNADAMSIEYSGTPALKTDFTRLGRRTMGGAVQDGINSLKRYFLGNFYDHTKQDALDLTLGKLKPKAYSARSSLIPGWVFVLLLIGAVIYGVALAGEYGLNYFDKGEFAGSFSLWLGAVLVGGFLGLKVAQGLKSVFVKKPALVEN